MDKLTVVPFEVEHAVSILGHPVTEETLTASERDARERGNLYRSRGPAFTAVDSSGEPLGAAGVMILWPGVGEAWILFRHDAAQQHRREAYELVLSFLFRIVADLKLRRVQAHCHAGLPVAVKYLENIGFRYEGTMRKYGPDGADHLLYAMIMED